MTSIRRFTEIRNTDRNTAGGKGASLGELTHAGIPVPPGFVVCAGAFDAFVQANPRIEETIDRLLTHLNTDDDRELETASGQIRAIIEDAHIPERLAAEIIEQFRELHVPFVAVRSSATAEDGGDAAWAGQLETYLNTTEETLLDNVRRCWSSLFTPRALFYRVEQGLRTDYVSVAVVVQAMVNADVAGVAFTVHPVTQDRNSMIIEAAYGLGEAIVSGQVTPDGYVLTKQPFAVQEVMVSTQEKHLVRGVSGGVEWKPVAAAHIAMQKLTTEQLTELGEMVMRVEEHYGFPVDIEWAMEKGELYIVQSRPITTLTNNESMAPPATTTDSLLQEVTDFFATLGPGAKPRDFIYEFQQRDEHPLLMSDFWGRALQHHFADEIGLEVGTINSLFTATHRGYIHAHQKAKVMQMLRNACEDRGFLRGLYIKTQQRVQAMGCFAEELHTNDVTTYSRAELAATWKEFDALMLQLVPWYYIPWYLSEEDIVFERVRKGIAQHEDAVEKVIDMQTALSVLVYPRKQVELQREQEAFFALVADAGFGGERMQEPEWLERAQQYLNEFGWQTTFVVLPKPWMTMHQLQERVQQSLATNDIATHQAAVYQKMQNDALRNVLMDVLKDDPELLEAIDDAQELGWLLTWSVEHSFKALGSLMPFYQAIAQAIGINFEDWVHMTSAEITTALETEEGVPTVAIAQRRQAVCYAMVDGAVSMVAGAAASVVTEYIDTTIRDGLDDAQQLLGTSATPGHARGAARLTRLATESKQVQEGEVLVCAMTSPEYVPAMKRAAAIVTDEGGLLCHAAIVSRELGKPCVVGTRNATQVFETGDVLDVDAYNGVVRKVESQTITFHKSYTRDTSLILQQAWFEAYAAYAEEFDIPEIYAPVIHYYEDGVVQVWENQHATQSWMEFVYRKNTEDPAFFETITQEYQATLAALQKEWASSDRAVENHLQQVIENIFAAMRGFIVWYYTALNESTPKVLYDKAITLRDTDSFFDDADRYLRKTLAEVYPSLSNRVTTLLRADIGNVPTHDILDERWKHMVVIGERDHNVMTLSVFAEQQPMFDFVGLHTEIPVDTQQLHGTSAYNGIVRGIVRLIKRKDQISLLQDGEILVSPMTTPEYVPAMKKAAAIVTDEGGMLCHAAIVAREMGKPCVVGTGIATYVLRDGDEVEVNANDGIVTILSRASV